MAAIPTIGLFSFMAPVDPKNRASPKAKMPPSEATIQYPFPVGVAAIPTMGWLRVISPVEPKNLADPNEKIPPSDATIQYPWLAAVVDPPSAAWAVVAAGSKAVTAKATAAAKRRRSTGGARGR